MVVMASFLVHNLLILKSRDSYTTKGSVDETESNESWLQDGFFVKQNNYSWESGPRESII